MFANLLLLLAPLALAQSFVPPAQCVTQCIGIADLNTKCAPLANDLPAFADCVKPLCSGAQRAELEKCTKCTSEANDEPIELYWERFDMVCSAAGVNNAASAGVCAVAAPLLPALVVAFGAVLL
ncbi:hypothetical protein CC85DRAFT_302495 [Cutaneotrichosporon oleaginosum]|uniref:Extracellular membrane protein CFEM domain-containing protein n=1 Tax=Cutaneotrichosporon oleaginosum TaxID=879819 RepID=A0A0J1B3R2_9TREE|nr:uncharacterized protein CC85DRAFT_302495 [Cutaneotrichosporon oleaginosum]KLT42294.1 hypothetical protein CC85DRAFT_302495 [Cutaneotrichosporon oleaginosum]TXT11466.1 hypothetical protein COLE_01876 [Cutaneotrichosporon oleaginosum]